MQYNFILETGSPGGLWVSTGSSPLTKVFTGSLGGNGGTDWHVGESRLASLHHPPPISIRHTLLFRHPTILVICLILATWLTSGVLSLPTAVLFLVLASVSLDLSKTRYHDRDRRIASTDQRRGPTDQHDGALL